MTGSVCDATRRRERIHFNGVRGCDAIGGRFPLLLPLFRPLSGIRLRPKKSSFLRHAAPADSASARPNSTRRLIAFRLMTKFRAGVYIRTCSPGRNNINLTFSSDAVP